MEGRNRKDTFPRRLTLQRFDILLNKIRSFSTRQTGRCHRHAGGEHRFLYSKIQSAEKSFVQPQRTEIFRREYQHSGRNGFGRDAGGGGKGASGRQSITLGCDGTGGRAGSRNCNAGKTGHASFRQVCNLLIEEEIERTLQNGGDYTIVYFDMDNFKAFNDVYGFEKGDLAIKERVRRYYSERDRQRGYIEAVGRNGRREHFPLLSVTAAAADSGEMQFSSVDEITKLLALRKKELKAHK